MINERTLSVDHSTIFRWVQRYAPDTACNIEVGGRWLALERAREGAVRNLIFNYISVIGARVDQLSGRKGLRDVAQNWEKAMSRLNINPEALLT